MSRPVFFSDSPQGAGFLSAFCIAALSLAALPALAQSTPGSVSDPNLFRGITVTSSTTFDPNQFGPANAVDGATSVFAFADDQPAGTDVLTFSGLTAPLNTIRIFDSGQYTNRASGSVVISTSPDGTTFNTLGTFALPTRQGILGDSGFSYYLTPSAEQGISYDTLSGLAIPTGTTSLQFNFTQYANNGPAFAEIQGFNTPSAAPEPPQMATLGMSFLILVYAVGRYSAGEDPGKPDHLWAGAVTCVRTQSPQAQTAA